MAHLSGVVALLHYFHFLLVSHCHGSLIMVPLLKLFISGSPRLLNSLIISHLSSITASFVAVAIVILRLCFPIFGVLIIIIFSICICISSIIYLFFAGSYYLLIARYSLTRLLRFHHLFFCVPLHHLVLQLISYNLRSGVGCLLGI